ncbi:hypothetical protein OG21DRAFT_1255897 [Imleria badia]|nr:hypothetical protein OG21DRAFT_1255897 [Imleria badia]
MRGLSDSSACKPKAFHVVREPPKTGSVFSVAHYASTWLRRTARDTHSATQTSNHVFFFWPRAQVLDIPIIRPSRRGRCTWWETNTVHILVVRGTFHLSSEWVYVSHAPFLPQAVRHLPAPDRPLPPPKHIPSPGDTDIIPMFTRTESLVHRDVDLNVRGRERRQFVMVLWFPHRSHHQSRLMT